MALPHSVTVAANRGLFRITSPAFRTANPAHHASVVNGQGATTTPHGARYNYPGVVTVYLTEDPATCFAERLFYFHREYLQLLDHLHLIYPGRPALAPSPQTSLVIWEVRLGAPVAGVADLNATTAGHFQVFPSMLTNPSQDYEHLKSRRAHIQAAGYRGIRAPSSRDARPGARCMLALFAGQSGNVASITPHAIELSLVQPGGALFTNHASQQLDFERGAVRVLGSAPPAWATPYASGRVVRFRH